MCIKKLITVIITKYKLQDKDNDLFIEISSIIEIKIEC